MALWYVDNAASGANNGTSWTDAWLNFTNVTGLSPGDTVWISGGASSTAYSMFEWLPPNGTSGNPILFQISPEAGHNGFVDISASAGHWIRARSPSDDNKGNWITISGEYNGESRMKISSSRAADMDNAQGLTFKYLQVTGYFRGYDADSVEIDHVEFLLPGSGGWINAAAVLGIGRNIGVVSYPTGFTRNLVHDCIIPMRTKNDASGFGDDGIKNVGNMSIYNNTFIAQVTTYTGGEHSDGIQTEGPNLLIYDNYFEGILNYPVFLETGGNKTVTARVYNNVFYNNPSANVALGSANPAVLDDILVFNNTIVGPAARGVGANGVNNTYTNTYVHNNLFYNVTTPLDIDVTVTASNNTDGTTANIAFVNPTSDFHLQAGSTAAIDQGISPSYLTSVTTVDYDGVARPQGSAWDIGAYEFGSGTAPSPVVIGRCLRLL